MQRPSKRWLLVGIALIALSQLRWGIGVLAFVAPVPFLKYLRETRGIRSRALFALALFAAYTLATLKIVSDPVPPSFALLFATPVTIAHGAAFLASDALRRRASPWLGVTAFPAAMVIAEYVLHRLTSFGSWAAAAYTQVDNLPLLQVASLFGLAGVSFAVYLVAAAAEAFWADPGEGLRPLVAACATLAVAVAFGTVRLAFAVPGETAQVAAVGTDATLGGWPLPGPDELARVEAGLLERTGEAARAGAKLVAWNEVATAVTPQDEPAFQERLRAAARQHGIELVAAYVVPLSESPPRYENKYVWIRPGGEIDHTYLKRHPVPGEPATPGTAELRAVETAVGRATGALCYDYDFPSLALEHARLGIDLAVVPSSDWRGIDPIHTQMASLRAIEGGFSLLRSTRFGLSAGFDQYGRARGWESSFDSGRRVLLVALPTRRIETLYRRIGDVFVALCAALVAAAAVGRLDATRRSRAAVPADAPSPSTSS